jgi:hypothetical protein
MTDLSTRLIEINISESKPIDTNLHIKVTATKSRLALPNSAKVEIFNVSEATFKKMLNQPRIKIDLDGELLFSGKIINALNEYKSPDWLCTIFCNDIKTNPFAEPQYMSIPKGTSNDDVLSIMASALSEAKLDTSAFAKCQKSKGSLLKQMVIEYKKEGDILTAIENTFKRCNTKVFKEDGVVKLYDTKSVINQASPIILDELLESPKLSHKDIVVRVPINTKLKLGLGFNVKAKSLTKALESPYTYSNQFNKKTYSVSELVHEVDNFTTAIAQTTVKGLNFG